MKVFQFDSSTGEFDEVLQINQMDTGSLRELDLQSALDAVEARVEVHLDQWTYPAQNRSYHLGKRGTWIMKGEFGRHQDFVIACNPDQDGPAVEELREFCEFIGLVAADADEPTPEMPNWVACNLEGTDSHVVWVAYFRGEPSDRDFWAAYEDIRLNQKVALEPEKPEEIPNRLSQQMGLRRYLMGQAV